MATRDTEVEAVEAALNTLAVAETDAALEKVVARLLPALLAALATKSAPARAKIVQTLQHINVRLRASPRVVLPFEAVLDTAVAPDAALMTRNVAIQGGYVGRCFARCTEQGPAFWKLISAASCVEGQTNKDALFALSLKALQALIGADPLRSQTDGVFRSKLDDLSEQQVHGLFSYGLQALQGRTKEPASSLELLALVRICTAYAGTQSPLKASKVFPLLIVASGDTSRDSVSTAGDDALKRIDSCDVLLKHDPSLVQTLFDLFFDPRAEAPLRCLVISKGLLRANLSASCFPEALLVVEECLFKPGIPERLRNLGMQYVSFIIANATDEVLRDNAVELHRDIMKIIRSEVVESLKYSPIVQGSAYAAFADLLIRVPQTLNDFDVMASELLFGAAQSDTEPNEVRSAASQALLNLVPAFSSHLGNVRDAEVRRQALIGTLRHAIENRSESAWSARSAAVLWTNQCFPFEDPRARFLNIIAAADDRPNVQESALSGLSQKKHAEVTRNSFTSSSIDVAGVEARVGQAGSHDDRQIGLNEEPKNGSSTISYGSIAHPTLVAIMREFDKYSKTTCNGYPSGLRPASWAAFLRYGLTTLRYHACWPSSSRKDNASRPFASPFEVSEYVQRFPDVFESAVRLRELAERCIFDDNFLVGDSAKLSALYCASFLIRLTPTWIEKASLISVNQLVSLCNGKCTVGGGIFVEAIANICGSATSTAPEKDVIDLTASLTTLLEPDVSGRPSSRHGEDERVAAALCLGYILRAVGPSPSGNMMQSRSSAVRAISRRLQVAVESSLSVRIAACKSLAVIGSGGRLALQVGRSESSSDTSPPPNEFVFGTLIGILQNAQADAKLVEAAALASGRLCVGDPESEFKDQVVAALLATAKLRREDEIRFSVGESLVRATVGVDIPPPFPPNIDDAENTEEQLSFLLGFHFSHPRIPEVEHRCRSTVLTSVSNALESVIELCYSERPNSRAAGCVFLVTFFRLLRDGRHVDESSQVLNQEELCRYAFAQEALTSYLLRVQQGLTLLLGDRSDFVQQLASRGISLVYDMASEDVRFELVSTLVQSLTSGKRRAATTVAGDEGALLDINGLLIPSGSTVDPNGAVSGTSSGATAGAATYTELCALATDMGQPDLVYKFLDLASHNALWNSRRGAALAGSAILDSDLAASQLRPYLKKLVPRLYVYCHDPADDVRSSMSSVLKTIARASGVGSISALVSNHFDSVAENCVESITSRQWRQREAGCGALRDLLSSRRWPEVEHHIMNFWCIGLRAMDDIKESVRKAAEGLGRALSAISVRLCDPSVSGHGTAKAAVVVIVPCILPAFTHAVKEVRIIVSETLSAVIRHGGSALKPLVPQIFESLLEAATELEPVVLNYVQFHVDASERAQLEEARASAASLSSSPVVDSLERLCALVDEENVQAVVSGLVRLARTGVGVPTRAATARLYSSLLSGRGIILEPYATKMMKAAVNAARQESSISARRTWCNAVGKAARLAPVEAVEEMVENIQGLSESNSVTERSLASFLARGLWQTSPETARQHCSALMPVAYMGRFDDNDNSSVVSNNWNEVWNEGAPNSDAGLRLFANEITEICTKRLAESTQYAVKRSAAAALGGLATAHNSSVENMYLAKAVKALVDCLPGHIWDGKEAAVEALGKIGKTVCKVDNNVGSTVWDAAGGVCAVVNALMKECSRGKPAYRISALESLSSVLRGSRESHDFFPVILPLCEDLLKDHLAKDSPVQSQTISQIVLESGNDDYAVDSRNKARKASRAIAVAVTACLDAAYPSPDCPMVQKKAFESVANVLVELGSSDRDVRIASLEALFSVLTRTNSSLISDSSVTCRKLIMTAMLAVSDGKYVGLRENGYSLLLGLASKMPPGDAKIMLSADELGLLQNACLQDSNTSSTAKHVADLFEIRIS